VRTVLFALISTFLQIAFDLLCMASCTYELSSLPLGLIFGIMKPILGNNILGHDVLIAVYYPVSCMVCQGSWAG
jgi:hypothetical protein